MTSPNLAPIISLTPRDVSPGSGWFWVMVFDSKQEKEGGFTPCPGITHSWWDKKLLGYRRAGPTNFLTIVLVPGWR